MDQSYEIPTKSCCTKKERNVFWDRIIEEQKASGMSAPKFCRQHQIPFSKFRNRKYRFNLREKQKTGNKKLNEDNSASNQNGFIQLEIADKEFDLKSSPQYEQHIEIKITFKNRHVIEITSTSEQEYCMAIIEQVSKLPC